MGCGGTALEGPWGHNSRPLAGQQRQPQLARPVRPRPPSPHLPRPPSATRTLVPRDLRRRRQDVGVVPAAVAAAGRVPAGSRGGAGASEAERGRAHGRTIAGSPAAAAAAPAPAPAPAQAASPPASPSSPTKPANQSSSHAASRPAHMRVLMFIMGYVTSVAPALASADSRKTSSAVARRALPPAGLRRGRRNGEGGRSRGRLQEGMRPGCPACGSSALHGASSAPPHPNPPQPRARRGEPLVQRVLRGRGQRELREAQVCCCPRWAC